MIIWDKLLTWQVCLGAASLPLSTVLIPPVDWTQLWAVCGPECISLSVFMSVFTTVTLFNCCSQWILFQHRANTHLNKSTGLSHITSPWNASRYKVNTAQSAPCIIQRRRCPRVNQKEPLDLLEQNEGEVSEDFTDLLKDDLTKHGGQRP